MYGKINPYPDPAQFDGDFIPREMISAKNGRVVRMRYEIGDEDAEPIFISESYAKRISTKPVLPPKATIKKPTGFKPGVIYFDENPCYTSTYQWDDRKFWENHTVAEFIMFAEYVDVIYGWRKSLHREKESYSVRLNPIQELVFDASDIYLIEDMRVVIENAMNEGLLDINLYESMSFGFYNLVKFIYHIPRYSRGGKW